MTKKLIVSAVCLLVLAVFTLLYAENRVELMSENQVEQLILDNVDETDGLEEIAEFFNKQGWDFVYDKDLKRFQARNLKEDELPNLLGRNLIYVYVTDSELFSHVKVLKIFP